MFASVTHVALPIAPDLVSHEQRGRAIGTVMTGLLLGILLARTFSGWVSGIHGWRWVFVVAAVMNAAFVPLMRRVMPKLPPKQKLRYSDAMKSLWTLFRTQPLLRESSVDRRTCVCVSFSCFWTTLAFLLHSHYGLGAGVAGTFGVVGAAGAMVAPLGRTPGRQTRLTMGRSRSGWRCSRCRIFCCGGKSRRIARRSSMSWRWWSAWSCWTWGRR